MTTDPAGEQLYDTAHAARILNVPASLISKWKNRRLISPADTIRGRGRGGRVPLYRLDDLRPLADDYHQRRSDTPHHPR